MRIFLLLLILAWTSLAWAAPSVPVKISSNSMQYSQKADQVVFSGAVHVTRLDIELWSDTLTVILDKKQGSGNSTAAGFDEQGAINKIIAQGNVRIKADKGRSGNCGKATYDAKSEVLTMEDNPILMEGANKIQGEVIKLFIKENRSEVVGGKKRVEAIFITPPDKPGLAQ